MHTLDRVPVVIAAAATGTAAVLVFALLPIFSGALARKFQLDDVQTGLVATSYFSVYAIIAFSSSAWVRRFNWKTAALFGYAAMLTGLLLCLAVNSFVLSSVSLAIVGAGAGLLYPISLTLVSDMEHTDRTYAIKLAAEQLVPAAVLFLLSSSLFIGYGLSTLLIASISVVALCLVLSSALPTQGNVTKHTEDGNGGSIVLALIGLLALTLNFSGFAGLWAFLEVIADERDFDPAFTGTWLAVGLITSGVGPLIAAALADRWGRLAPITVSTLIALSSLFLLVGTVSKLDYAMVLIVLPMGTYFAISYIFCVVAEADHNGKMAGQMSFALAIAAGGGPVIFGLVRADDGPAVLGMGVLMALGAVGIIWVHTRIQRLRSGASSAVSISISEE
ncbi:MAG: MFS transporter [Halioglobus sp.]